MGLVNMQIAKKKIYDVCVIGSGAAGGFMVKELTAAGARPLINTTSWGWTLTPYGIAKLTQDLAWVTACHRNQGRIEELERDATDDERFAWGFFGYDFPEFGAVARSVWAPMPGLLREIVGNPFRPVVFDPAWRRHAAVALARQMYDERDFGAMPVLADALQDAGCEHPDILGHCRSPGRHL